MTSSSSQFLGRGGVAALPLAAAARRDPGPVAERARGGVGVLRCWRGDREELRTGGREGKGSGQCESTCDHGEDHGALHVVFLLYVNGLSTVPRWKNRATEMPERESKRAERES